MAAGHDLAVFCDREYPRLVGALDLYVGDLAVAEEIAQEALVRASQRWSRVSQLDSPGGWTYRVAINLANSWFRRRAAERRARRRLDPTLVHHDPDTADHEAVRTAMAALPERQRTALVLRYYLDLPATEVADRLGTTPGAVRAATKRAIASLRQQLGPQAPDMQEDDHVSRRA
jgi:RNA polymerase sigma-70 factor (sigma-E family)